MKQIKSFILQVSLLLLFSCQPQVEPLCKAEELVLKKCYWKFNRIKVSEKPLIYAYSQCFCANDTIETKTKRTISYEGIINDQFCIEVKNGIIQSSFGACNIPDCLKKAGLKVRFEANEKEVLQNAEIGCSPIELTKIEVIQ